MRKRLLLYCLASCTTLFAHGQRRINDSLVQILAAVSGSDEVYRDQLEDTIQRYGADSRPVKSLFERMRVQDSIDQVKVCAILDRFGWLGPDVVGEEGNSTFFFVVQHAELPVEVKYLPMLRAAVQGGRAKARHLALLEDRVNLRQGKNQVYGSQIGWDMKNNWHYVLPLDDPDHVDQRRAAMGLPPMSEYLQNWQMKWDADQYKKDLPRIQALYHEVFHP